MANYRCDWERRCQKGRYANIPRYTEYTPVEPCEYKECDIPVQADDKKQAQSRTGRADSSSNVKNNSPLENFDTNVKRLLDKGSFERDFVATKGRRLYPSVLSRNTEDIYEMKETKIADGHGYGSFAKRLMQLDKQFSYEQALMLAEIAVKDAPPDQAEELALAKTREYTMTTESDRKSVPTGDSDTVIEVISYMGVTKPANPNNY